MRQVEQRPWEYHAEVGRLFFEAGQLEESLQALRHAMTQCPQPETRLDLAVNLVVIASVKADGAQMVVEFLTELGKAPRHDFGGALDAGTQLGRVWDSGSGSSDVLIQLGTVRCVSMTPPHMPLASGCA